MSGFSNPLGTSGLQTSSSSQSGPATGGAVGIQIQGITTGGASNSGNSSTLELVLIAGVALVVVVLLLRRR